MNAQFQQAVIQQAAWKPEFIEFARALVSCGLILHDMGCPYFGTDDVGEPYQPQGHGIAGSVCEFLKQAHVIEHYYGSHPESGINHGRRRSTRKSANGRKIDLYHLCSVTVAEEWLARHGGCMKRQQEFGI